jgi:Carboxypeptidase regulatory-like domain/TonB dependent receptor
MRKVFLLFSAFLLLSVATFGQSSSGAIAGRVTDPSGARVPHASVTATESSTGLIIKSVTSSEGDYQILNAPPGLYTIAVVAAGFKTLLRESVSLQIDDKLTLDLALELGSTSEHVTVTEEAPLLRTQDAQTGEVINQLMIQNLPQLDRDPLELLRLSGDVAGSGAVSGGYGPNGDSSVDTRINGGRMHALEYSVDGINVNTGQGHGVVQAAVPTMETVGEFKVVTNGLSAEYGHTSGGIVDIVSKGGTNQIHGELFEYFKNDLLNANDWTDGVLGNPKSKYHDNDFGFAVGGPIVIPKVYNGTNKSFFYFNYEGKRHAEGGVVQYAAVPTLAERGMHSPTDAVGTYDFDLSGIVLAGVDENNNPFTVQPQAYDPAGAIGSDGTGPIKLDLLGGTGYTVPAARVSPLIEMLLDPKYTPLPNTSTPGPGCNGDTLCNNYRGFQSVQRGSDIWDLRLDHNFSDSKRLYFRFARTHGHDGNGQWFSPLDPGNQYGHVNGGTSAALHYDWVLSPTLILETRAALNYTPIGNGENFPGSFSNSSFPFDSVSRSFLLSSYWDYYMSYQAGSSRDQNAWGSPVLGTGTNDNIFPSYTASTIADFAANLTKIVNTHNVKFGVEHRRYYDNRVSQAFGNQDYGGGAVSNLNYGDTSQTQEGTAVSRAQWQVNSFASMLLGLPEDAQQSGPWFETRNGNYYAGFVQDDFKVSSRLTINAGIRWDMETPITDRGNNIYAFDQTAKPWSGLNLTPGFSWTQELTNAGLTPAQIASLPVPNWVANGLPNGRVVVSTASNRELQSYHWKNFAPRFGVAYQIAPNTVLRGSIARMFAPTQGDFAKFQPNNNDSSANLNNQGVTSRDPVTGNYIYNNLGANSLYPASGIYQHVFTEADGNHQYTDLYTDTNNHMPDEWNYGLGIQHQLKWGFLLEADYNGNHSSSLMTTSRVSDIPSSLVQPQYQALLATQVANPWGTSVSPRGDNWGESTGYPGESLADLYFKYPQYGRVYLYGINGGTNNYNAAVFRLERRMKNGFAFLVNYTFSKDLDDVGSPDYNGANAGGQQKNWQTGLNYNNSYGISPLDSTHRLTFYHDVQFPIGQGRRLLGHPNTFGSKVLDRVVGGWEYAGIFTYVSGTPVQFEVNNQGAYGSSDLVYNLFGSFAASGSPSSITGAGYKNDQELLVSPLNQNPGALTVRRFNSSQFLSVTSMQYGDIPATYGGIRNPGLTTYDASIMKNFYFSGERSRYLQVRLEAQNAFNMVGLGGYDANIQDTNTFGLITGPGQSQRQGQISARFFF